MSYKLAKLNTHDGFTRVIKVLDVKMYIMVAPRPRLEALMDSEVPSANPPRKPIRFNYMHTDSNGTLIYLEA